MIAGPNGSGKSTSYDRLDPESVGRSFWIINPDILAREIAERERLDSLAANLRAVERLEIWLEATLHVHRDVGVETVLSTDKYRRLVNLAHELGFAVHLVYVLLDTPQLNVERVRARVARGGHAVPEDKIVSRYWRSLAQLPWFAEHADIVDIFDNSGAEPRLVGRKRQGELTIVEDAPANLIRQFGPGEAPPGT